MDQPNNKKQKVVETSACKEAVLFNNDALSKVISYLPSIDVLNLALSCKRFTSSDTNDELSLIEESAQQAVKDLATEEQLAALPHYDGESTLADYHYLLLMKEPLLFDQLVGDMEYVDEEDKTCAQSHGNCATALSNNIMRTGKHFVSFIPYALTSNNSNMLLGVMRPGQVNQNTRGIPTRPEFFQNFTQRLENGEDSNQCCMYDTSDGYCYSSNWIKNYPRKSNPSTRRWESFESMSSGDEVGMLLDLDEGTLSVYKNGRKLGQVRKSGLIGQYCWVVSMHSGMQVSIKRGTIPS